MKTREELITVLIFIRDLLDAKMLRKGHLNRHEQLTLHMISQALMTEAHADTEDLCDV